MAYDALLLVSFGGPERREDVIPFLENVLRGRNVPRERMLAVAEHYYHFDGKTPINDQNRALSAAVRLAACSRAGPSGIAEASSAAVMTRYRFEALEPPLRPEVVPSALDNISRSSDVALPNLNE